MFFIMEDRDDEININADRFGDSYARDTSIEELKEVSISKHPIGLRDSYFFSNEKKNLDSSANGNCQAGSSYCTR
jgi:hypothetical protein